jgi:hypothetical protein
MPSASSAQANYSLHIADFALALWSWEHMKKNNDLFSKNSTKIRTKIYFQLDSSSRMSAPKN